MDAAAAARCAKLSLRNPIYTWPGYSPAQTPIAIYDDHEVIYLNHPAPPAERPVNLLAATSLDLNGVQTATIPAAMVSDEAANQIRQKIEAQIAEVLACGAVRIRWPAGMQVQRAFSPRSITALGDGRLVHTEFVTILLPAGKIAVRGALAIEDYGRNEILFAAESLRVVEGRLKVQTDNIEISLEGVEQGTDKVYQVHSPVGC